MSATAGSSFSPDRTLRWIELELAQQRIVGGALAILHKGQTVLSECFGLQNTDGDPVTRDTRFWIASMTKPIVSVAAMQLVESGKLSLLEPVNSFIPEFASSGVLTSVGSVEPVSRQPVVLDLLTHTSGLTYGQFGTDDIHRRYAEARVFDYTSNNEELSRRLARLPLLHQPGTTFEYGMSTDVLGHIVEIVSGCSLDKALSERVLMPLRMEATSFVPDQNKLAELAPSIIQETLAPDFNCSPSWFSGGAGLFSTVSDYMQFARMLLEKGRHQNVRILKSETLAMMSKAALPAEIRYGEYTQALGISAPWKQNGLSFGLGLAVRTEEISSVCGGLGELSWPGVSGANFWVDPKNDLIVVFLTHAPAYRTDHRVQLRDAVYRGFS